MKLRRVFLEIEIFQLRDKEFAIAKYKERKKYPKLRDKNVQLSTVSFLKDGI
jgi:hypothetical protein